MLTSKLTSDGNFFFIDSDMIALCVSGEHKKINALWFRSLAATYFRCVHFISAEDKN